MVNQNTKLSLYNGTQWVDIPIDKEIPLSLNFSISDIREPDKTQASGSKTVVIPFSKESLQFFEMAQQVNVDFQVFNPNLKTPAKYYVGERIMFEGNLQLIRSVKSDNGTLLNGHFECNIVGLEGGFFADMGNMKLTDIDFSDLDHTLIYSAGLFNPTSVGSGYAYPYIDYGFGDTTNQTWKFEDLKCGLFEREILSRIFSTLGYTWTSAFLDSTFYKHLFIPDVNEGRMKQSDTDVANAQFYATQTTNQAAWGNLTGNYFPVFVFFNGANQNYGPGWVYAYATLTNIDKGYYNDDFTPPYFDTGGVYSTVTDYFTCNLSSIYQLTCYSKINLYISHSLSGTIASQTGSIQCDVYFEIQISTNGGATWSALSQTMQSVTMYNTTSVYSVAAQLSATNIQINSGDICRVYIKAHPLGAIRFYTSTPSEITTGTSSIVMDFKENNFFWAKIINPNIQYNQTVSVNNAVPKDVYCKDFFKWIIQRFNLRVEPSKTDPYNLVIEPYKTFYTGSAQVNWTNNIDVNSPIEVTPMGELQGKNYLFRYKEDSDVYNDKYQKDYLEPYGSERIDIVNDFIKGEKRNEIGFSNTPGVGNIYNTMVVPKLYKEDGNNVKSMKCNIRSVYWGGLKTCTPFLLTIDYVPYPGQTQYAYVGFVDDPYTPTVDLSFDNPYQLYYAYPAQQFTNSNLYNIYWKQYIEEITDKNSKIIKCKLWLNENDIRNFSFRNIVFIIDSYYIVNRISNYDPLQRKPCDAELLKLKSATAYIPALGPYEGEVTGYGTGAGGDLKGNLKPTQGLILGGNNQSYQDGNFVQGDGNVVN